VIVCTKCGFQNESGDSFCGSCGAFLEWSGESVATEEPVAEAPPVEFAPAESRLGFIDRVKDKIGIGEDDEGEAAAATAAPSQEAEEAAAAQQQADEAAAAERAAREAAEQAARARQEAEVRARAEAEERARAEEAARRSAEEAERVRQEAEARARAEAEERARAEEAARQRATEMERSRQEAEARARAEAEEAARMAAQAAAQQEVDAKARAEEEARRAAEDAERAQREAEAQARAEADARARAEDEARQRAEAERRAREEQEARRVEEEAARRRAEEEARQRAEAEAAAKAEADQRAREEDEAREKAELEAAKASEAAKRAAALIAKVPAASPAVPATPGATTPAVAGSTATAPGPAAGAGGASGPAARVPDAVKPAAPKARPTPSRQVKAPPSRQVRPGDLICGQCGEGNDPSRKFCRRCGASLVEAVVVPTPWYKKIFRRKRKVLAAGERPMRQGSTTAGRRAKRGFGAAVGGVFKILALVLLVGSAIGYAGPWRSSVNDKVDDGYKWVRRLIAPTYDQLAPISADATTFVADRPPEAAIDGVRNSFWAADTAQERAGNPNIGLEGEGSQLIIRFVDPNAPPDARSAEPVDIDQIGFTIGASETPDQYKQSPRPRVVHITFQPGGEGYDLELADKVDFQKKKITGRNVQSVEIQIVSVYGAVEGGNKNPAIAEVEFYRKGPR
jgi:hypothetical protein